MNPYTGKLYTESDMANMTSEERSELVELSGSFAHIQRISEAVGNMNRAERRASARATKKRGW